MAVLSQTSNKPDRFVLEYDHRKVSAESSTYLSTQLGTHLLIAQKRRVADDDVHGGPGVGPSCGPPQIRHQNFGCQLNLPCRIGEVPA